MIGSSMPPLPSSPNGATTEPGSVTSEARRAQHRSHLLAVREQVRPADECARRARHRTLRGHRRPSPKPAVRGVAARHRGRLRAVDRAAAPRRGWPPRSGTSNWPSSSAPTSATRSVRAPHSSRPRNSQGTAERHRSRRDRRACRPCSAWARMFWRGSVSTRSTPTTRVPQRPTRVRARRAACHGHEDEREGEGERERERRRGQ